MIGLVLIQGFGLVFDKALGIDVKLGPIFVLIPIAFASLLAVAIVRKLLKDQYVTKEDIFAIVVVFLLSILIMFFLPELVPNIFAQDMVQLQSVIGFP
jgi:hypothetical protein